MPLSAQKILAFLALHNRPLQRVFVASVLWPESRRSLASGCLRSAVWRVNRSRPALVRSIGQYLSLAPGVRVDFRELVHAATRVVDGWAIDENHALTLLAPMGELLRTWPFDWVVLERERLRLLRLVALEALSDRLRVKHYFGQALAAGLAAVTAEPLRESAHSAVIQAHLAAGNASEALRHYQSYRKLLKDMLGLEPATRVRELIRSLPK